MVKQTRKLHSFHPARIIFRRSKVLAFTPNYQWDSDTTNMVKYKKENDAYPCFAVFIDIFTRYLYITPLKSLTGQEMVDIFQGLIKVLGEKPQFLTTDQGSKYKNRHFNRLLNENKIKHFYTYHKTKANYADRIIETLQ